MNIQEYPQLQLFRNQTSKRLFFAKSNLSDTVWHILDFAISKPINGKINSMALHGLMIEPAIQADTIDEMARKSKGGEYICSGCLDAFNEAKDIIFKNDMLKFKDDTIITDF